MGKLITGVVFGLGLLITGGCEQRPEKAVKQEPEVVSAKIPRRVAPDPEAKRTPESRAVANESEGKTAEEKPDGEKSDTEAGEPLEKEAAGLMSGKPLTDAKRLKEKLEEKERKAPVDHGENAARQVTKSTAEMPGAGETVSVTVSKKQSPKAPMVTSSTVKGAGDKKGVNSEDPLPEESLKEESLKKEPFEEDDADKDASMAGESSYVSKGKLDPFHPLIQTEKEKKQEDAGEEKAPSRILTPLEKLDFSQMKLAAIVHAPSGNMAMVEESGGKGYIVRIGTFIGKNSGRVVKIGQDRIVIEERVKNFKGDFVERSREMKLHKKEYEG